MAEQAQQTKKFFTVEITPEAEKMWLHQTYENVEAATAEEAVALIFDSGKPRKQLQKDLLALARRKEGRLCNASVKAIVQTGKFTETKTPIVGLGPELALPDYSSVADNEFLEDVYSI